MALGQFYLKNVPMVCSTLFNKQVRKHLLRKKKKCSYKLKVLAVINALKEFKNNLHGTKFKILTAKLSRKLSIRKPYSENCTLGDVLTSNM